MGGRIISADFNRADLEEQRDTSEGLCWYCRAAGEVPRSFEDNPQGRAGNATKPWTYGLICRCEEPVNYVSEIQNRYDHYVQIVPMQ